MKTINIYEYDELPTEEAKEKARQWWIKGDDLPFLSETIKEELTQLLDEREYEINNIKGVYYSLTYSQGDGCSFEGSISRAGHTFYIKQSGKYCHENTMSLEGEDENGNRADSELEKEVLEELRELCIDLKKFGYVEIEYAQKQEVVEENIRATTYEFLEDGRVY